MDKKIYLIIFSVLLILLVGFYSASQITDFWISHLAFLGIMLFAAFVIIGLNKKKIPSKEQAEFKLKHFLAILVGIVGLIGVGNFIPVLATKIAGIEMTELIKSADFNRVFVVLISFSIFEEILYRRILAQIINNKVGLRKAVWISALIFSLAHIYSETGLLSAFLGGMILAYIYLKTNNIYLSIVAHLFYNLSTYFLTPIFLNNFNRLNEYSIIVPVLVIGSGLLYSMFWVLEMREGQRNNEKKPADNNGYN